jgi:hypothetical protein
MDFIRQEINFCGFIGKHGALWARLRTRGNSNSSQLCPLIGPVPTCTRTENPSIATPPLSGAIGDYCLFFTSGFHRSARWLRSKPPKLEATERHPVGHPQLRSPWPTHFVTSWPIQTAFPATRLQLSTLLDKLVPRRSSSNPFLARWGEAGDVAGSTSRRRPEGPYPGGPHPRAKNFKLRKQKQKRVGPAARCTQRQDPQITAPLSERRGWPDTRHFARWKQISR